jgi:hypothetical protein
MKRILFACGLVLAVWSSRISGAFETRWDIRYAIAQPMGSDRAIDYGRAGGLSLGLGLQLEDHGLVVQPQILYTNFALPGQTLVSGYLPDPRNAGQLIYVTNIPVDSVERIAVLEVPVLVGLYYVGRTIRPRLTLGPDLVMLMQKSREYTYCECGEWKPVQPTYVNLGWVAALGLDFSLGSGSFFLEARYTQLDPFNMWHQQGAVGPVNLGYGAGFIGYMFNM